MPTDKSSEGPFQGVRVLELGSIGPGPYCAMMLADNGAEVTRIDRPGASSGPWNVLQRGRASVILDLKRPEAVDALLTMVKSADVLLEGNRPGVAERLGFGPEECLDRNPGLVYGRMTGWGQSGPLANRAGHDIGYISRVGALHMFGEAGGRPIFPANILGDFGGGGMLLAFGVAAALTERARSGRGQVVDASIVDGTASLMAMQWALVAKGTWRDERGVNELDGGDPWYAVYETADQRWMAVGAREDKFYDELVALLGIEIDSSERREEQDAHRLRELLTASFKKKTQAEWIDVFADSDACVEPVLSLHDAARDDQVRSRDTLVCIDGMVQPGVAPRFSRTPGAPGLRPPVPGANTRQSLDAWGIDADRLIAEGVAIQT